MYEKKVAVGQVPATIVFYYSTDTIFNSVSLRSTFRARGIKDQEGISQLDDVSISPGEMTFVQEVLKSAVYDIFGSLFKITDRITENPITVDAAYAPVVGVAGKYSTGKIKDNTAYAASLLQTIDNKIENAIKHKILAEWYIVCGLEGDAKLNMILYNEYLKEMKNLTFELRKPLIT